MAVERGLLGRVAWLVSHLLNPAGLALLLFAGLTWLAQEAWLAGMAGAVLYSVMPGGILVWLRRSGYISELYPVERSQRAGLLLLGTLCYFAGVAVLLLLEAPIAMLIAGVAFACNTLLVWWINQYWKISIHAVGVSGAVSLLLLIGGASLWPALLALPLVAWARLHLRAHTVAQVAVGLLLGGISSALLCALVLYDG
ncbi:MAG: hypothetical protein AB1505_30945 [Candidatus Latescibacterota bacterium]